MVGEDLRVNDVGTGGGAGPGDDRQQARVIRRDHGQLGDAASRRHRGVDDRAGRLHLGHVEYGGVAHLVVKVDLKPVRRLMAAGVGVEIVVGPFRQRRAQFLARRRHAPLARHGRVLARDHVLGLPVERA